jgi:hypothetical protein
LGIPVRQWMRASLLGVLLVGLLHLAIRPAPAQAAVWVVERSGEPEWLGGVSCVTTTFCKAVGQSGAIYSYNGMAWSADAAPSRGDNYWDVDCVSSTFCKAVGGDLPSIASYNGTNWSLEGFPGPAVTGGFRGVACTSASFCKMVDAQGRIGSWNGSAWRADTSPTARTLLGVGCASAGFCKAVGHDGTILSWNGSAWSADTSPTKVILWDVSCTSTGFCIAVGVDGVILWFNGFSWNADASGTTKRLTGVDCLGPSFCKAVGADGTILSYNGDAWSADSSGTSQTLLDVSCVSTDFCKAAGDKGTIVSLASTRRTTTREHPVGVECAGTSQQCNPPMPFELTVSTSDILRVRFVASPLHCSDIRVVINYSYRTATGLGLGQVVSDFLAPGGSSEEFALDPPAGRLSDQRITLTAEGRTGGCNIGRLDAWSGTLIVTTSE